MAQDNYPEQEAANRKQETEEETAEEQPNFEGGKQRTDEKEQRMERPTIPDTQKPEVPREENIPVGGPGGQGQTQQSTQLQTQEEKIKKIKSELKKTIRTNTPQERRDSNEIEDKHNQDVLSQE